MTDDMFGGRCSSTDVDPITQEPLGETDDVIVFVPENNQRAGFCISREALLQYWESDSSWLYGDCRGHPINVEAYPDRYCRKYYKLPHTNSSMLSGVVDMIKNNPRVDV
uniref:Uncharacterized protein n=1 Tax=viral metagenome TaxID=1070528 RepID=A0A6C0LZP7_9ZZZZ